MTLELTPDEYVRLSNHIDTSKRLRHSYQKLAPHTEDEVLDALGEGMSACEIKRTLRVSGKTIVNIKKENGLWGA